MKGEQISQGRKKSNLSHIHKGITRKDSYDVGHYSSLILVFTTKNISFTFQYSLGQMYKQEWSKLVCITDLIMKQNSTDNILSILSF